MKKKKIAKLAVTLGLVGAVGVGGTLAALTAQSEAVTNTFAVGANLTANDIKLDEYALNDDNRTANKDIARVQKLDFKNLMQGDVLDKDPTVQIRKSDNVADCYMFVYVTGLDALADRRITVNWDTEHWVDYNDTDGKLDGYYYYVNNGNSVIENKNLNSDVIVPDDDYYELPSLFTKVTVADNAVLYEGNNAVKLANIEVEACAVQAQNVESISEAFSALPVGFGDITE